MASWVALIASLPMWLVAARGWPPIATLVAIVGAQLWGDATTDARSHRRRIAWLVATAVAIAFDTRISGSWGFGNSLPRSLTIAWILTLLSLRPRARRILAVNVMVLVVTLIVAEVGLQVATGRRLSSEETLARFRAAEGGPVLDPRRSITRTDDLRTTTGHPARYDYRVFVFGGSTTYCGEVDDSETIPSVLQARLNDAGERARVLNYGQVMVDAVYSNAWLQSLTSEVQPRIGDIVIFYVGVNDAGSSFSYTSRIDRWASLYDNLAAPMRVLNRHSAIASQAFAWLGRGRVSPNDQTDSFAAALDDARRHVEGLGATFVPVLQPTLFTETAPDVYEQRLAERSGADLIRTLAEVYPRVAERVMSVPGAVDARGALAAIDPSPYVDWMHLDARGNTAVADVLFDAVLDRVRP